MVAHATNRVNGLAVEIEGQDQPTDVAGGVALCTSQQWPRTDDNCLPSCLRVPVDTNSDTFTDHVATVRVRVLDDNGNGRFDRGVDRVLLDPTAVERIDPSARLSFGDAQWRAVVRRAAAGL